ncbi:hypothetical protein FRC04_002803 [Tulasnella sp. 424]|nr:hypothetical protein FRC04_002803 [Tulasnella sp. 424]KAG8966615.1 hypothetical protein FRC05_002493 [Tulasnella sp. 425]
MELLQPIAGPHQIILTGYNFHELDDNALRWVTVSPTVTSLTLRGCDIHWGELWVPVGTTTEQLHAIVDLRKSNIKTLDLDNSYKDAAQLPLTLALLTLIPSLETLIVTPRSFRSIGQLPITLDLPPLRRLTVLNDRTGSINQPHLLSFLRRCPTLETLHISHMIFSRALEAGELPVDMPNLRDYEGRAEYLTLIRAPALRRVVVRSLQWDGAGAVIRSLASTQSCLETAVLDLAARMDGPAVPRIKSLALRMQRWVEEIAARRRPPWRSTERFSLVLKTAPLGEWIYSAKVGRTDSGEPFIEYYNRREESMAYLATCAN